MVIFDRVNEYIEYILENQPASRNITLNTDNYPQNAAQIDYCNDDNAVDEIGVDYIKEYLSVDKSYFHFRHS